MLAVLLALTTISPPSDGKILVNTGSHGALTKYVAAQQKCGFHAAKIETASDGREYVAQTEPASELDRQEAYACIMVWGMEHEKTLPIYVIERPLK